MNLYRDFLSGQNLLWGSNYTYTMDSDIYFRIKDINADGIPELILYNGRNSNADGQLAIYADIEHEVKYVMSFTMYSVTFYCNKQGALFHQDTRYFINAGYYKYNGKSVVPYIGYFREWTTDKQGREVLGPKSYHTIDEKWQTKSISKKKFTSLKNKLLKGKKNLVISGPKDMYQNTAANRKKHIK